MAFFPDPPIIAETAEGRKLAAWVFRQFNRLSGQQSQLHFAVLTELHEAPEKPADGMMVYADGADWDPGSGKGFYRYNEDTTAWVLLG